MLIVPGLNGPNATPDSNYLSLKGNFKFKDITGPTDRGSFLSIINEDVKTTGTTESSINLNKLQGHIGFESRIQMKQDTVVLDNQVKFNHLANANSQGKVFTAEMAMSPAGNMQKIADLAITGGAMRSTLGITPR